MDELIDTYTIKEIALGLILIAWIVSIYFFERLIRRRGLDPLETWRERTRFYVQLAALLAVLVGFFFIMFGGFVETAVFAKTVIFWIAMGGITGTLMILMVRYLVLLGAAFLEFHVGDGENEATPVDELDISALPFVSVIVPAYNEEKVIAASIASLLELDYPEYEIIVVDDGSKDATYTQALDAQGQAPGKIRVLTQVNQGKAAALNHGIRQARGEYVLCMDADSRMAPKTLKAAVRHMLTDPGLGAVAGAVKVVNRDRLITRLQALEYIQGLNIVRQAFGWAHMVNIIPGPCGLFRRTAVFEVGGYDSDTFAEDCDLTIKLLIKGWRVKYEPEAQAFTEAPETLRQLYQQRYRWTRGIIQAVSKHRSFLLRPSRGWLNAFVLWYMLFETLIWPFMNLLANGLMLYVAFAYGVSSLLVVWWLLLTALDVAITLLSVGMEDEDPILIPHAILYRLYFTLVVDVCKVFATLEEFLGVGMSWGKLTRVGRL